MAYRSEEQQYNDHRQATGFQPQGPLAFGQFEVGRSSMPKWAFETYQYKSNSKRLQDYPHMEGNNVIKWGDPGAYDPYGGDPNYGACELFEKARFTFNRSSPAFNARSERRLGDVSGHVPGKDSPGPGAYGEQHEKRKKMFYPTIAPGYVNFKSGSLQRPTSHSTTPDAGRYDPNYNSVFANMRDSGASMRSSRPRMNPSLSGPPGLANGMKSMTSEALGPGAYDNDWNTLGRSLKQKISAQSRRKPGFGTVAAQRALPFEYHRNHAGAPGPGAYQPSIWTGKRPGTRSEPGKLKQGASTHR